jgi:hypothetical protein
MLCARVYSCQYGVLSDNETNHFINFKDKFCMYLTEALTVTGAGQTHFHLRG